MDINKIAVSIIALVYFSQKRVHIEKTLITLNILLFQ